MGKIIKFPTGGRDGLPKRDKDAGSAAKDASNEAAEERAQYWRSTFKVVKGGKDD